MVLNTPAPSVLLLLGLGTLCSTLLAAPTAGPDLDASPKAEIMDLLAMTDADVGPVLTGTLRAKLLVSTREGSLSVQTGNASKHTHQQSLEIQYVVSGSGTFWLGDSPRQVHAGDLIVIPKGVTHGGSHANSGELKMLAFKLPPAVTDDVQPVP